MPQDPVNPGHPRRCDLPSQRKTATSCSTATNSLLRVRQCFARDAAISFGDSTVYEHRSHTQESVAVSEIALTSALYKEALSTEQAVDTISRDG
jgi:hypothetical protein